jgi:Gpi18-like mannosyltransferase
MEQTAVDEEEATTLESTALEQQGSGTVTIRQTEHRWLEYPLRLLSSFPSRVFFMAALFYIALTGLHLWLQGASADSLAGWGAQITASWRRFDTAFFLQVAHRGYTNQGLGAFFPLYPYLVRGVAYLLGKHFTLAALVVAWACAWGSFCWFYRLAEREYGERIARLALLFLAFCPVGLFAFAPYSESVFLLVSIGAVERARAGRFWQAGLLGALGMLARPTGILLLIPLGWECLRRSAWFKQKPWRDTRRWLPWLSLALIPVALLGYMLALKLETGNPLAFLHGENLWSRHLTMPWETTGLFALAFQHAWQVGDATVFIGNIVDLLLTVPLPVLVLYLSVRKRAIWFGAALYQVALTLLLVAIPVHPGPDGPYEIFFSTQRFMLPAFPLFLLMGQFGLSHPRLYRVLLVASAILLTLNTLRFLDNIFIA